MMPTFVGLTIATLALTVAPVLAADRFVARRGTDGANTCTSAATPCATIGHALAQVIAGDVVKVERGSFKEKILINTPLTATIQGGWNKGFVSRATGTKGRTKMPAPRFASTDHFRSFTITPGAGEVVDLTLDGFVFSKGFSDGVGGGVIGMLPTGGGEVHLRVVDSTFEKNQGTAATIRMNNDDGGPSTLDLERVRFLRNNRANTSTISITATATPAVVTMTNVGFYLGHVNCSMSGNVVATLTNTTMEKSWGPGISATPDQQFPPYNTPTLTLRNTTTWGTTGSSVSSVDLFTRDTIVNLDHSNIGTQFDEGGLSTFVDLGGNLSVDPRIRALRLLPGSPMIDAGTATGAPSDDLDGDTRPAGLGVDIGADEFVP